MMSWFTPKRIIIGVIAIGGTLVLIGLVTSWLTSGLKAERQEAHDRAVRFEEEAKQHRERADALEKQMAARDELIKAKDELIEANSRKAESINEAINQEETRFQSELAAGADLTSEQLRERICARFKAAGIKAEAYCAGTGTR